MLINLSGELSYYNFSTQSDQSIWHMTM